MTPAQKLVLEANMAAIEADDVMRQGVADDRVYDVVLAATGSVKRAEEALRDRIAWRLRRGEKAKV